MRKRKLAPLLDCPHVHHTPGHCGWCDKKLTGRQQRWCSRKCNRSYVEQHRFTNAKAAAKKRVTFYRCESCGEFHQQVEVNHIVPCKGMHKQFGCWHHSDNLEVLCRDCHREETNKQRKRGWT